MVEGESQLGLLAELRDLAADDTVPLERVLLRCMVLADILGDEALMQWLGQELDGYKRRSDVPDYRIVQGQAKASVTNGVRYETIVVSRMAFPVGAPKDFYDRLNTIYFTDSVKELERLQDRVDLVRTADPEIEQYIEQNVYGASRYRVREAYIPIPPAAMSRILGAIRSRTLQYVFRLRKDYPEFDQHPTKENAPSPAHLTQMFQIIAPRSAVSIGSGSAYAQSIGNQIITGDLESLRAYLRGQGVEPEDLGELDEVLAGGAVEDLNDPTSRIRGWIDTVAEKASAGGKELATTAAKELIRAAVRFYFGNFTGQ